MPDAIGDAIAGMTKRQLEDLVGRAQKALRTCVICGSEHADAYVVSRRNLRASLHLCPACFARHRLPEGRATETPGGEHP